MHSRSSLFVNVRRTRLAAKLIAGAAACGLTSACVGNPFEDARVDPRSPIAAEVTKSVRADAGPELPPVEPGNTEAFARDQKARATPPPKAPR